MRRGEAEREVGKDGRTEERTVRRRTQGRGEVPGGGPRKEGEEPGVGPREEGKVPGGGPREEGEVPG